MVTGPVVYFTLESLIDEAAAEFKALKNDVWSTNPVSDIDTKFGN